MNLGLGGLGRSSSVPNRDPLLKELEETKELVLLRSCLIIARPGRTNQITALLSALAEFLIQQIARVLCKYQLRAYLSCFGYARCDVSC
jgi:hypothetical protein